jgi:hypothetical protein
MGQGTARLILSVQVEQSVWRALLSVPLDQQTAKCGFADAALAAFREDDSAGWLYFTNGTGFYDCFRCHSCFFL